MLISQGQTEISIGDILVGDVWLLGAINMELPIRRTLDLFEEEVKTARNPFIGSLLAYLYDFHGPRTELSGGEWKAVTPKQYWNLARLYFRPSPLQKIQANQFDSNGGRGHAGRSVDE